MSEDLNLTSRRLKNELKSPRLHRALAAARRDAAPEARTALYELLLDFELYAARAPEQGTAEAPDGHRFVSGLLCRADGEGAATASLLAFTRRTHLTAALPQFGDDYALIPFPMLAWLVRQQELGSLTIDPGNADTEYTIGGGELAALATGAMPEAMSDGVTAAAYRNEQIYVSCPPVTIGEEVREALRAAAAVHPEVSEVYLYETRFWSDLGEVDVRFVEAAPEAVIGVYCDPAPDNDAHCQRIVEGLRAATAAAPALAAVKSFMFLGDSELMSIVRERGERLYRRLEQISD